MTNIVHNSTQCKCYVYLPLCKRGLTTPKYHYHIHFDGTYCNLINTNNLPTCIIHASLQRSVVPFGYGLIMRSQKWLLYLTLFFFGGGGGGGGGGEHNLQDKASIPPAHAYPTFNNNVMVTPNGHTKLHVNMIRSIITPKERMEQV